MTPADTPDLPAIRDILARLDADMAKTPLDPLQIRARVLHDAIRDDPFALIQLTQAGAVTIHLHGLTATAHSLSATKTLWHAKALALAGGISA